MDHFQKREEKEVVLSLYPRVYDTFLGCGRPGLKILHCLLEQSSASSLLDILGWAVFQYPQNTLNIKNLLIFWYCA